MPYATNLLVGCRVKPCISTETKRHTFARAVEITSGMETAAKNARSLHESDDNPGIKHVTYHLPCKHCGQKNHEAYQYRIKSAKCHNCSKQTYSHLSAELLKRLMPQIADTKSKEVIPVDEAIRDRKKSTSKCSQVRG